MKQSQSFESKKVGIVDVKLGVNITIIEPANLYGCTIGDGSFVGPFVEIQSDAIIGKNCRIQSHSFFCSKLKIGDHCFIGHGVTFTNDLFKDCLPSPKEKDWLQTILCVDQSISSVDQDTQIKCRQESVRGTQGLFSWDVEACR